MMRRGKLACVLILTIGALILLFDSTGQMRNMAKVRRHIPSVIQAVGSHPEFQDIRPGVATAQGGVLVLEGTVTSRRDLDALKAVVLTTNPPVKVNYAVRVTGRAAKRPAVIKSIK